MCQGMNLLEALGQHGIESSLHYGLDGLGWETRARVILDGSQKLRRATFHPRSSAGPIMSERDWLSFARRFQCETEGTASMCQSRRTMVRRAREPQERVYMCESERERDREREEGRETGSGNRMREKE